MKDPAGLSGLVMVVGHDLLGWVNWLSLTCSVSAGSRWADLSLIPIRHTQVGGIFQDRYLVTDHPG